VKVLSINSGSSSLRWGLFEVSREETLARGKIEEVRDAEVAWRSARAELARLEPDAVGHRVVHGGEHFTAATRIGPAVLDAIEAQNALAPEHNPRCLLGIHETRKLFPDVPHVAVFDTAFHQSMPPGAFVYGLPYRYFEEDRIRRYGFHGTSHRFAAERAASILGIARESFTGVTCHLGNGCSIAAIRDGRSVDTSMGMTPLAGLVMGTRSGDVDPAVVLALVARRDLGSERVTGILNEESGLLGLSGVSSDLRRVETAAEEGDERARLALDVFAQGVRRGIGSALGVLGRADAIVFTGGIGENAAAMRERILGDHGGLGIELDAAANAGCVGREGRVSSAGSRIALLVVCAQEEWLIARETETVLA
jgi:acetate kinase